MLAHPDAVVAALRAEPGMKVADFGVGRGSHVAGLSEAVGPAGRVYAIDVQKALVDRLAVEARRRGLANVDALWADLEVPRASGLADGALDRVLLSHVLFQVDSKTSLLAEAFRALKPGGRVLIVEWSPEAPAARLHGERVVAPAALADLLAAAGFKDAQPVSVGTAQHALAAQKP